MVGGEEVAIGYQRLLYCCKKMEIHLVYVNKRNRWWYGFVGLFTNWGTKFYIFKIHEPKCQCLANPMTKLDIYPEKIEQCVHMTTRAIASTNIES